MHACMRRLGENIMELPYFYLIAAVVAARPAINSGEVGYNRNLKPLEISPRIIVRDRNMLWLNGIVPYSFAPEQEGVENFDEIDKAKIYEAMRAIQDVFKDHGFTDSSCQVKFVPRTNAEKELNYVEFFKGHECSSDVGRIGGRQRLSLARDCVWHVGTIIHELCHALGFNHEHQSPDRDSYVKIIEDNLLPNQSRNMEKLSGKEYTHGGVRYDPKSVMQYYGDAFGKPVEGKPDSYLPTIVSIDPSIKIPSYPGNDALSRGDWIKLHLLYCPKHIKVVPELNLVSVKYNSTNGVYWRNSTLNKL